MKNNHSHSDDHEEPNMWKKMFYKFVENYTSGIVNDIKAQLQEVLRQVGLKTTAAITVFVGGIFLLIAIVIGINEIINQSSSIGFAIVGFVTVVSGIIVGMRK